MTITCRYINAKDGVHIELSHQPLTTLCGFHFNPDGSSNSTTEIDFGELNEPYIPSTTDIVTCPHCCEIIDTAKTLQLDTGPTPRLPKTAPPRFHRQNFIFCRAKTHIEFVYSPFQTLCGIHLDPRDPDDDTPLDPQEPAEPNKRIEPTPITCPLCAAIISLLKTLKTDPLPNPPDIEQPEPDDPDYYN